MQAPPEVTAAETSTVKRQTDHHVLQIHHDLAPDGLYGGPEHAKTTGVMGPGQARFRHEDRSIPNLVTDVDTIMAQNSREAIPAETVATIIKKADELRALIAETMGVSPQQLRVQLGTRTRLRQTLVEAKWDRFDG